MATFHAYVQDAVKNWEAKGYRVSVVVAPGVDAKLYMLGGRVQRTLTC